MAGNLKNIVDYGKKMDDKYFGGSGDVSAKKTKEKKTQKKENLKEFGESLDKKYFSKSSVPLTTFAREYAAQKTQHTPINKRKTSEKETDIKGLIEEYQSSNKGSTQSISPAEIPVEKRTGGYYHSEITADPKFSSYRQAAAEKNISADQMAQYPGQKNMEYMTQEEKDVYDYLAGKEGMKRAEEYRQRILSGLNTRMTEETKEKYASLAKKNPLAGVGLNAVSSVMAGEGYVKALEDAALGRKTDPNSEAFLSAAIEEATREGIKEKTRDTFGSGAVGDFLVDTGLSMSQNLARIPMGGLGLVAAGAGAATGGYKDAAERGGSEKQALLSGAAQGGAEAFFEKFSLEGLEGMKTVPVTHVRDVFENLLKQSVTEGSEEAATEIANVLTDNIIMKDLSNYQLSYKNYLRQGLNEEEAIQRANMDVLKNVGLSAAGGALSGGVMGGGAMALNRMSENASNQLMIDPEDSTQAVKHGFAREYAKMNGAEFKEDSTREAQNSQEESAETTMEQTAKFAPEPIRHAEEQEISEQVKEVPTIETKAPLNVSEDREQAKEIFKSFGENGMNAAVENFDGSVGMAEYHRAFGRYYDAGRYNSDMEAAGKSAIASILTPEQAMAAYKAGIRDRNVLKPQEYTQGEKKEGSLANLSQNATNAQVKLLEGVGKRTGLKITLADNLESGATAEYTPGEIRISANSRNFLETTSHELTHFLKDNNREGYESYATVAVTALMEAKGASMDALVESYTRAYEQKGQTLSRDEIIEEIVSDATGEFLNDEKFIEKVTKKDRTIAEKVIDFLNDIIDAVKELINHDTRKAAKALKEDLRNFELARDIWMESLEKAGENYREGRELVKKTETRYELEHPELVTEENLEENHKTVRDMEPVTKLTGNEFEGKRGVKYLTEAVTEYYNSLGNVVHNDVVGDIVLNRRSVKDDVAHGYNDLKAISFKAVPEVLKNGKVLQYTKDWKGRGYDSVVIGAQIEVVSGELKGNYYQLCTANVNKENNKMYLHEVQVIKTNGDNPFKTRAIAKSDPPSGDAPSIYSIFDKLNGVNRTSEKRRFQLDDIDTDIDVDALVQENENLKAANEYLSHQLTLTKDYQPRKEDIRKVAKKLLGNYNSSYKLETLEKNLGQLYEYIRSSDRVDGREVTEAATAIARSVLDKSQQVDTGMVERYKDALTDIRTMAIVLPEENRSDMDSAGGYQAFRKKYFGKIRLGNTGIGVDTAYEELSGKYPELFPTEIANPADQLIQIADVIDSVRPQIENPYKADIDEMSYIVGQEIFDAYFDVRNLPPTKADKMKAEADRVRREYSRRMSQYKEDVKAKYAESLKEVERKNRQEIKELWQQHDAASKEQKEEYKRKIEELRNDKNKRIRAEQELYQKRLQDRRERSTASKTRQQIIKEVRQLGTWLVNPTDKKHVPEALRKPLAEFLGSIDFSSNRLNEKGEETVRTKAWNDLKDVYVAISNAGGVLETEDGGDMYLDIDPDIVERMKGLNEHVKDLAKLENLSYKELEDLKAVVLAMKHSIQDADKMRMNGKYESVAKCAMASMNEMRKRGDKLEYSGTAGRADRMMRSSMLDAYTMFSRFGPAAESVYSGLRKGLDQKIRNTKTAQDYISELLKKNGVEEKDIREWSGKNAKKTVFKVTGGTVEMTPAQVMSLYVLNQRKQAHKHIYNRTGGIKVAPSVEVKMVGGKVKVAEVIKKGVKPVAVTPFDVLNITGSLTEEQKAIADGIVKFFTTQTSSWGNEVSMELYGYKKFMAPNYFPIVTDKNYVKMKTEDIERGLGTLKNMGSTKATVRNANNPIIIEDIFDVYTRQADQMGSYNAFVVPLSDLQKFYNFNHMDIGNVKQELERAFGKDSHEYIETLMKDINGMGTGDKDLTAPLIRNMKSASVGYNIRTAVQQPTAYVRALAEIDAKYLIQGLKLKTSDAEWENCKKYAPIAQWKDWGYFDVNTGRSMKSILIGPESTREKIIEASMELAGKGDELTWRRIWEAVKAETDDMHPELTPGTEEYYSHCGNRMSEIIDRTQVVDSVLHRSALMKKDGIPKLYTSFMSEPTKSYNMLYRAWADVLLSRQQNGKADKAKTKRAEQVTGIWLLSGAATALAAALVDALRDDDEEKKLGEQYVQAVAENLTDNWNPLNMIPLVKDAVSIAQGFSVNRIDMQGIQYFQYAMNDLQKYMNGESKYTFTGMMYKFVKPVSLMSGVAASNLMRDVGAVVNTMCDSFGFESIDYAKEKMIYSTSASDNLGMYITSAMKAYASGNQRLGDKIISDLKKGGMDLTKLDDRLQDAISKEMKRAIDASSPEEFKEYAERLYKEKTDAGMEKKEARKSVRNILTRYCKQRFLDAGDTERYKMKILLEKLKLDGEQLYKDDDFKTWIDESKKR